MFGKHWKPARATVVATRIASTTGDGTVSITEFVVDVRTPEGEMFRAKLEEPRIAIDFKPPTTGIEIAVEYDPKSHDVRFDKDDPAISWKAYKKSRKDSFEETLAQPPGSPAMPMFPGQAMAGNAAMGDMQAIIQAAAAQGGVVRLDSSDPAVAELRQFLLGAVGQPADVPAPTVQDPHPPADQG